MHLFHNLLLLIQVDTVMDMNRVKVTTIMEKIMDTPTVTTMEEEEAIRTRMDVVQKFSHHQLTISSSLSSPTFFIWLYLRSRRPATMFWHGRFGTPSSVLHSLSSQGVLNTYL